MMRWSARARALWLLGAGAWPSAATAQTLELGGSVSGQAEADSEGDARGDVQAAASGGSTADAAAEAVAAARADRTHVVQEGDTLWGVSETYYGDPYQWPRLWSFNPEITNPHYIYPGDVLNLGPGAVVPPVARQTPSRRAVSRRPPASIVLREQAYLDRDALERSGVILGSNATHMLLSTPDEAYVKFERSPRAPVGKELTIYRHVSHEENSPVAAEPYEYDPEHPGEIVRVLGTLRVDAYDADTKVARGEIVEALDVIERGFRVAEVPRRFLEVSPRTNDRALESTVVAAMRPVELIGQNQVVFLGVGDEQGVKPGNRFFVVRRHDAWRRTLPKPKEAPMGASRPTEPLPDESQFPEDILAEIVVLHTRPESATAMVTHSVREIAPGDRARMPDGY